MIGERHDLLVLDRAAQRVTRDGTQVPLTPAEYRLLLALVDAAGHAISSRNLLQSMWGITWEADSTPLQEHIDRLRDKLGESAHAPRHVITVHGYGYRFEREPDVRSSTIGSSALTRLESRGLEGPEVYVMLSTDRVITFVSSNVERLLGWSPPDLIGRYLLDLGYAEDPGSVANVRADLDAGRPMGLLINLRKRDGEYRLIDAFVRPIITSGGEVAGFLAEWRPFDQERPPRVIDPPPDAAPIVLAPPQAPDGSVPGGADVTLTLDRNLRLRAIDPLGPVLGWQPDEILGTFFSPTGMAEEALRADLVSLMQAGTLGRDAVVTMPTKQGEVVAVRVVDTLLVDEDGGLAGLRVELHRPDA